MQPMPTCNKPSRIPGVIREIKRGESVSLRMTEEGKTSKSDIFVGLYKEFCPRVKALLMKQGASQDDAEDIAHETIITAWQKSHMFDHARGSMASWVFTIARNKRIDLIRKRTIWQEYTGQDIEHESEDLKPDEQVEENETVSRVQMQLGKLPEDQQIVLKLSFIEGLAHGEIAERLSIPLGTVKSRIRLAYKKLKSELEDET